MKRNPDRDKHEPRLEPRLLMRKEFLRRLTPRELAAVNGSAVILGCRPDPGGCSRTGSEWEV